MIDAMLERRFPDAAAMETVALRRIPGFVRGYMAGGIGAEGCLGRNRSELDAVRLMPCYLCEEFEPDLAVEIAGARWAAPFGVAPLGLGGLIWPGAEQAIARAAAGAAIGHVLSTYATTAMEGIAPLAGPGAAFQLYPPADPGMEADMIARAHGSGYRVLMVTVDIPGPTRRRRDIMSGLSVPPRFGLRMGLEVMGSPRWALGMACRGIPEFQNLSPYFPKGGVAAASEFLGRMMIGHIGPARLARIRAAWPGRLIVKGVLDPDEAAEALVLGADGIVVSNHGGRQLDAAPTAVDVLPAMRARLGEGALILADGGVRSGLDMARLIGLGADAVLVGRPFLHAVAAAGARGPAHLTAVLRDELRTAMIQLGARTLVDLRRRVWRRDA
jgi:L-lactate dehydrogenase (cytochrome)